MRRMIAFVTVGVFLFGGAAFAEKSMWQKFKDFFNPGESIDCEGPVCDELHGLESKINTIEGRYSRERRPKNKERFKKELDSLYVVRDSLVAVIKMQQSSSSVSSAVEPHSSVSYSSATLSSASYSSSSLVSTSAAVANVGTTCKPDTVYVRDTVVIHDTLYVVVTNKPAEMKPTEANPAEAKNVETKSAE